MLEYAFLALTLNIFMEAEGEGVRGMEAVSHVTFNRVDSKHYPNDLASVVLQRKQFSWTSSLKSRDYKGLVEFQKRLMASKKMKNPKSQLAWRNAQRIAVRHYVRHLFNKPAPNRFLHFHATYVKPYWAKNKKGKRIGRHIFYD